MVVTFERKEAVVEGGSSLWGPSNSCNAHFDLNSRQWQYQGHLFSSYPSWFSYHSKRSLVNHRGSMRVNRKFPTNLVWEPRGLPEPACSRCSPLEKNNNFFRGPLILVLPVSRIRIDLDQLEDESYNIIHASGKIGFNLFLILLILLLLILLPLLKYSQIDWNEGHWSRLTFATYS